MPETSPNKPNRVWSFLIILLVVIIFVSVGVAWSRYQPARPIEISLPTEPRFQGSIQVSGEVTNPGIYPFNSTDTVGAILQSAGGTNNSQNTLELSVSETGTQTSAQKININRAEVWLLESLPGIGETKAKAIIAYREQNGAFKQTSELMKVSGIAQSLYDQIKGLITVTD